MKVYCGVIGLISNYPRILDHLSLSLNGTHVLIPTGEGDYHRVIIVVRMEVKDTLGLKLKRTSKRELRKSAAQAISVASK